MDDTHRSAAYQFQHVLAVESAAGAYTECFGTALANAAVSICDAKPQADDRLDSMEPSRRLPSALRLAHGADPGSHRKIRSAKRDGKRADDLTGRRSSSEKIVLERLLHDAGMQARSPVQMSGRVCCFLLDFIVRTG